MILREELQALAVSIHGEVKASQPVSAEAVGTTAHDHRSWLVHLHHFGHDWLVEGSIGLVVNAVLRDEERSERVHREREGGEEVLKRSL